MMKLIVSLGNFGKEYNNTRHNIGFSFLDYYLDKKGIDVSWGKKFDSLYLQTKIDGEKVIFMKPQTYVNLSGNAVKQIVDYYDISLDDILIISDDLDLNIGNFKLKKSGSSGGHNGLKSIETCLKTSEYKRLKIGISKNPNLNTRDYVLGKLSLEEKKILDDLFAKLVIVIDDYFVLPFSDLMSKYNQKNR